MTTTSAADGKLGDVSILYNGAGTVISFTSPD